MTIYQIHLKLKKILKTDYSGLTIDYRKTGKMIFISDRYLCDTINISIYDNNKLCMKSKDKYIEWELNGNNSDIYNIIYETKNIFGELIHGSKDYYYSLMEKGEF
jgi:hypothetical protein